MTFYPTCELLVWVSQLVQTARVRDVTEIRISLSCASLVFFVDTSTAGLLFGTLCFPNHQQLTLHIDSAHRVPVSQQLQTRKRTMSLSVASGNWFNDTPWLSNGTITTRPGTAFIIIVYPYK